MLDKSTRERKYEITISTLEERRMIAMFFHHLQNNGSETFDQLCYEVFGEWTKEFAEEAKETITSLVTCFRFVMDDKEW